jgi:D-psicose/D-tagatose/L-ribulose 3-epimerase
MELDINPIGCHGLVWTSDFRADRFDDVARRIAEAGFDLFEVPLMDPWGFDAERAGATLRELNLQATLSVGHGPDTDISSEDPAIVAAGEKLLIQAIEQAARLGASQVVGVLYSQLKRYLMPVTPAGRGQSQRVLARVADHAASLGLGLSLEVVNRYETNVFNTLADAADFVAGVGRANVKLHVDSFHMNIEETNLYSPLIAVAELIGYAHVSENTRGYLGSGGVRFGDFFRGLADAGYTGPITFETFSSTQLDPDLAGLLAVWRPFYDDTDALAAHAASFVRSQIEAARSAA